MNNEENAIPPTITNLPEFSTWVKSLSTIENATPQAFFYRGHANADYELQPTAYRMVDGASYRIDESRLYHEMLRRDPMAFAADSTLFERLVRMQHYGLPTRLLDLTQSSLVALFFACTTNPANENKNGSVLFFKLHQRDVLHQQTLSDTSLAGVNNPLDFSQLGEQLYNSIKNFLEDELEFSNDLYVNLNTFLLNYIESIRNAHEQNVFSDVMLYSNYIENFLAEISKLCKRLSDELKNEILTSGSAELKIKNLETQNSILDFKGRLKKWKTDRRDEIAEQIGVKENKLSLRDFLLSLTHFYFVSPPMNNERIRRQHGAFLVFSPIKSNHWPVEQFNKPSIAIIQADAKKNILQELARMGISESYLFPELDKQAIDICNLYPRQKDIY